MSPADRPADLGPSGADWFDALLAGSSLPAPLREEMARQFASGRRDQLSAWADRAESLDALRPDVRAAVLALRRDRAARAAARDAVEVRRDLAA